MEELQARILELEERSPDDRDAAEEYERLRAERDFSTYTSASIFPRHIRL